MKRKFFQITHESGKQCFTFGFDEGRPNYPTHYGTIRLKPDGLWELIWDRAAKVLEITRDQYWDLHREKNLGFKRNEASQ